MNLSTPLKNLPRIAPRYAKILEKMKLVTVQDFLFYFPFRYDDFSKIVSLSQNYLGQVVTTEGKVTETKNTRLWKRRLTITEITLQDTNDTFLRAVWFNQPFISDTIKKGETIRLSGKLVFNKKHFSMASPAWEKASRDATNTGRIVPIYSETAGITSKWIRWQMKMLLPIAKTIPELLPDEIRKKYHLYDIYSALCQIHFPENREKMIRAQKRFAFQEMLLVQLRALGVKKKWENKNAIGVKFDKKLIKDFVSRLPFNLTNAQRKTSFEILKDLEKEKPMNRLLNGDVGSGKTVVAAIAALEILSSGYQVALMAPTEILARQHFESFCELFKDYDFNIALLTNSYKLLFEAKPRVTRGLASNKSLPRNDILENISSGKINLAIGTHAIIQKDVLFKNLALVIIDEQHRFGVVQRAALQQETMSLKDGERKTIPHLLTMTATPIPRTLAIAFFGSLDLSILDEMPKNRKPITTKVASLKDQNQVYTFIRSEIKSGRQTFIIFPLVSESEKITEVKAATEEHKRLSEKIFPELKLGLIHGKLGSKEKREVMDKFKDREYDILVSTSVVEVGIDIPNATIIVIENAERFGLSQLHQFRGRVGRGGHQSYCFLFTESESTKLQVLEKSNDGFEIAEHDLKLRGPGQFFGTIQSGLPDIAMENLTNIKLIKFSRFEAQELLRTDSQLKKHPLLADALGKFQEKIHLE